MLRLDAAHDTGVPPAFEAARPIEGERLSIGRRAHNDVVLDNLTVSGEHALILRNGIECTIRDLGSRNGTVVNGNAVTEQRLVDGDLIEIGIYRIRYIEEAQEGERPSIRSNGSADARRAEIEYLSGVMRGVRQPLERGVMRIGGNGHVAALSQRRSGWFLTHLEGARTPCVNGRAIGHRAVALKHDDLVELDATRLRFRLLG